MKKSLVAILLVLAVCLTFAGMADATCGQYGRILYSYQYPGVGGTSYFYISDSSLPTYYYYYYTTDDGIIADLVSAQNNGKRIYISGNAASCPTTGTYRYGGTINYVINY